MLCVLHTLCSSSCVNQLQLFLAPAIDALCLAPMLMNFVSEPQFEQSKYTTICDTSTICTLGITIAHAVKLNT